MMRKVLLGTVFALAVSTAGAMAAPVPVTFDPGLVVSGNPQFTADKLNLLDFARVDLGSTVGGLTNFNENGLLQVNNASLNNVTFNPSGNGSSYTLYLQFIAAGTQNAPNFTGGSQGTLSSLSYTLWEAPGASTFGIDAAHNPFVTNGSAPTQLAHGSLIAGTTSFSANPLGAGANVTATFLEDLLGFVVSPKTVLTLAGAFNNDSNIVNVFNGGKSFTLNGGGGDLTFTTTAVPEPASLALLGSALVGLGMMMQIRRKRS